METEEEYKQILTGYEQTQQVYDNLNRVLNSPGRLKRSTDNFKQNTKQFREVKAKYQRIETVYLTSLGQQRLGRSTARYIYKNCKLLAVLTLVLKAKLLFKLYIYKRYLIKIYFNNKNTDILKILQNVLFCSVKGHFKAL